MLRCTIEMIPQGQEDQARPLGIVEIANTGGDFNFGDYTVTLKKTPPWKGALKATWKKGNLNVGHEDEEIIVGGLEGLDRHKRGPYDLLFLALKACGLDKRTKAVKIAEPELGPVTPRQTYLLLLLTSADVTEELVEGWTQEQRELAAEWAAACHVDASDGDVDVPPRPEFLPPDKPFQMFPSVSASSDDLPKTDETGPKAAETNDSYKTP